MPTVYSPTIHTVHMHTYIYIYTYIFNGNISFYMVFVFKIISSFIQHTFNIIFR